MVPRRTLGFQHWGNKKAELEGRREVEVETPTVTTEGVKRVEEQNDDEKGKERERATERR